MTMGPSDKQEPAAALPEAATDASASTPELPISVIVPVRNAEAMVTACLDSIVASRPREIIVVDGMSTDRTFELVRRYPVQVLSDEGRGVAAARVLGVRAATSPYVALIDVDVVLPKNGLAELLDEFRHGGYAGLQAGLRSESGPGYWGRALVAHHRSGRSKDWFGLVATIFERDTILRHGLDEQFASGEDIELRWRLERSGARVGVSKRVIAEHWFGDTWGFALGQWLADGRGLGRMVVKNRWRAAWLLALPLAAGVRGSLLSLLRRQPRWIPYYISFIAFNYVGMVQGVARHFAQTRSTAR